MPSVGVVPSCLVILYNSLPLNFHVVYGYTDESTNNKSPYFPYSSVTVSRNRMMVREE